MGFRRAWSDEAPDRLAKKRAKTGAVILAVQIATVAAACGGLRSSTTSADQTEDVQSITSAFNTWEFLPSTCQGVIVPGTLKTARLSSGVSWAIATFMPATGCSYSQQAPGYPRQTFAVQQIGPWGAPSPPIGVFERQPGQRWSMNQEGGTPFPCPDLGGHGPGPENGAIPPEVLAKWHLKYAPDCSNVAYPARPR